MAMPIFKSIPRFICTRTLLCHTAVGRIAIGHYSVGQISHSYKAVSQRFLLRLLICLATIWLAYGAVQPANGQGLLQKAQMAQSAALPGQATVGQEGLVRAGQLQAGLVSETTAIVPGQPLVLGLRLIHDPHWHTYWRNPGDSGLATTIEWQFFANTNLSINLAATNSQWRAGPIQWPTPTRLPVGPLASFGFEGDLLLPIEIAVPQKLPANLRLGDSITISAQVNWLVCKDVCIPGDALLAITLPTVASAALNKPSADAPLFDSARKNIPVPDPLRKVKAHLTDQLLILSWASTANETPGFFYPYTEALISPSGAQKLFKTNEGYRLEIALGESPRTALQEVRQSKLVGGVWVAPGLPAQEWQAGLAADTAPQALSLIDAGKTAQQEKPQAAPTGFVTTGFLFAVLGAFVGGMILNLMPCVFPVIGLKVLSFAQSAHSRRAAFNHALIFSLGIILSFMALALLLVALRAAGEAVGWGFQLQSPLVVMLLALLFVAIALNLAGVFEMGLFISRMGNLDIAQRQSGSLATFGSGVLAVVVASPCTAPFMGGAIGFTATAGIFETLVVFAALGLGMALPYLLLSVWPGLLSRMPRPGAWMVRFKQAMAFPMLAAAAWLFWVLASLQGADVILVALLAALLLAFVLWIYGAFIQTGRAGLMSLLMSLVALGLMVWAMIEATEQGNVQTSMQNSMQNTGQNSERLNAGLTSFNKDQGSNTDQAAGQWQAWAPGLPEQLAAQGKTVFVDFTASWCISCQANKVRVLQSKTMIDAFNQAGVVLLRADWTRKDADIANELARHGRNGVPLYLVYSGKGGPPKILSEWLTNAEVLRAIR